MKTQERCNQQIIVLLASRHQEKIDRLAEQIGISRNECIRRLIDQATPEAVNARPTEA